MNKINSPCGSPFVFLIHFHLFLGVFNFCSFLHESLIINSSRSSITNLGCLCFQKSDFTSKCDYTNARRNKNDNPFYLFIYFIYCSFIHFLYFKVPVYLEPGTGQQFAHQNAQGTQTLFGCITIVYKRG